MLGLEISNSYAKPDPGKPFVGFWWLSSHSDREVNPGKYERSLPVN